MKNNSLVLYVLAALLLVSIGMYTYTSSQSTINDSLVQMSVAEVEAFNAQFSIYGGKQTGSKIKSLMGTLLANASTYREEEEKLPEVIAEITEEDILSAEVISLEKLEDYEEEIKNIRDSLEAKHTYEVNFDYSDSGVLNKIMINY